MSAFAVTERKGNRTLREKGVRGYGTTQALLIILIKF